ncbi:MAG TPA: alpha/beta hydrolase [bacterium]|nr:alpha/beta hydrolase [bacterium]
MLSSLVRQMLYYPTPLLLEEPLPPYAADAEEIWLDGPGGHRLHGLYWPAANDRPTILFFHGNAQSVYEWALVREDLAAMDCGLLLVDYPGYGKCGGEPNEESLYAAGRAWLAWLAEQVGPRKIILFGKSLGGGVVGEIAQHHFLLGIVLESTFRSIAHVAQQLFPMLPADPELTGERYATIEKIANFRAPLLIVHGKRDELIPYAEAEGLFAAANEPRQLYSVPGAGHNDVSISAGPDYGEILRAWLDGLSTDAK